jgi:hypothetical protein
MISKRTVFVLGAGAHIPYGFPSGKELMENIVGQLIRAQRDPDLSLRTLPQRSGVNPNIVQQQNIDAFINSLSQAGQASIDTFINANQHMAGFDVIGKVGIAQALLESEAKFLMAMNAGKVGNAGDWFKYLFEKMCGGISRANHLLRDNQITFITFNYDRLLELKLFNAIKNSFSIADDQEVLGMVNAIPVHHLYGSLGKFDPHQFGYLNIWDNAWKSIQTIYEVQVGNSPAVQASIEALNQAEKICLLGFGFHSENISLLELPKIVEETASNVSVSRYGVTDEEMRRVVFSNNIRHTKLQMGDRDMDALGALRNLPVFDS